MSLSAWRWFQLRRHTGLPLSKTLNHSINKPLALSPLWSPCWSISSIQRTVFTWHICSFFDKSVQANSLGERLYMWATPKGLWKAKSGLFFLALQCMIRRGGGGGAGGKQKANFCLNSNVIFACATFIFVSSLTRNVNFPGKFNFSKENSQHKQFFWRCDFPGDCDFIILEQVVVWGEKSMHFLF